MIIFISKTSDKLNTQLYDIETLTENICINPKYKNITLNKRCNILEDSSAFQEREIKNRLSYNGALERQLEFEKQIGQKINYIVSYDKIDDYLISMQANKFLLNSGIKNNKVVVCQGIDIKSYTLCLNELLELSHNYKFVLGFGGIAKSGINRNILYKLYMSIKYSSNDFDNINHIHLFGVLTNDVINEVRKFFPTVLLSCDTSSIEIKSVMGMVFNNGKWVKQYSKEDKFINYHPCLLAKENLIKVINYYKGV